MNKIFLAYPFRVENQPVVQKIERLVRSHGLALVTAEVVGGEDLTDAIRQHIRNSDALIAFFARVAQIAGTQHWITTDWVKSELGEARIRGQRAIALIEKDVSYDGLNALNEYIPFNRDAPQEAEAFVRLSETIGLWKQEAGQFLEFRLMPKEAEDATETMKCRFRVIRAGKPSDWTDVQPQDRPGGVFIGLPGVRPGEEIQVQLLEGDHAKWRSKQLPQWLHVELRKVQ